MARNLEKKATAFIIGMILGMTAITPAFADDYQTGIDAFTYGPYSVPAYDGDSSEEVNGNLPTFSSEELSADPYVHYGDLDSLGRCTSAEGLLSESLMPTHPRGSISSVKPSGWKQAKYGEVPSGWLYNRCHLIGWQLAGADENNLPKSELEKDLITGTRYLNVGDGQTGMVGYENDVAAYLKEDEENEVAYRVTPVFGEDNLVAYGVLMEGQSVDSNDVEFCAFCYNVQPLIAIDYKTGRSRLTSAVAENKNIRECDISVGKKTTLKNGQGFVDITVYDGDKTLEEGSDYQEVWQYNNQPGQGIVTIVGIGSYKSSARFYFVITPARAKVSKLQTRKYGQNTAIRIVAAKQKGVSGYQYSWRMPGKKWKKTSHNRNVRIVTGLKKGTNYQVRVRTFKKINGEIYYGKWSKVKKIRTKK